MGWNSETITHYGYTFKVTDKHMTPEEMVPLQYSYDDLGTKALEALDSISPASVARSGDGWTKKKDGDEKPAPSRDCFALLRDNADKDETLKKLWDEVTVVPDWVDWDQIKRGQDVLYRYAGPALLAFALHGLIGSAGASSRPAETLVRTGGHSVKVAKRRFFETFQLLLEVTRSLESVQPGGAGHASIIRVRFLHATVRQRILKLAAQRPGYFSVEKQGGMPINDLDAIQSVCAFSVDLLYMGLPAQGIYVHPQEAADYVALWRWVGYVIGAPVHYMQTPSTARAAMESVMTNCINPSANSRVISQNILKALDGVSPIYAPKEWWEAGGRFVNGDELGDALGLEKPSLYYWVLVRSQALVFKTMAYVSRSVPSLDKWMIETSRRVIWDYAIEGEDGLGAPSKFEFKYVPDLNERTGTKPEFAQKEKEQKNMGIESFVIYATLIELLVFAVAASAGGLAVRIALGL